MRRLRKAVHMRKNSALNALHEHIDEYGKVERKHQVNRKTRKVLIAEKQKLSPLHVFKHKELATKLTCQFTWHHHK